MKKKLALFAAIAAIAMPIMPVFAEDTVTKTEDRGQIRTELKGQRAQIKTERAELRQGMDDKREAIAQKRLEFQDKKEKMVEERCKNLETRISTRINRYENNELMSQKVYGGMLARLDRLVAKLKTAGADVTQLEKDIVTLNAKIDKLKSDHAAFMLTLKESQDFVCGKSEGEFKAKLGEARKVPEIIKQDRQDIKDFFQTTIKADLQAIRKTLAEKKEAATPTTPTN